MHAVSTPPVALTVHVVIVNPSLVPPAGSIMLRATRPFASSFPKEWCRGCLVPTFVLWWCSIYLNKYSEWQKNVIKSRRFQRLQMIDDLYEKSFIFEKFNVCQMS